MHKSINIQSDNTILSWITLGIMCGIILATIVAIICANRCARAQNNVLQNDNDAEVASASSEGSVYQDLTPSGP